MAALPCGQDTRHPIPEPWGSPGSARPVGPTGKAPSDRVVQAVSITRSLHQQPPGADIQREAAEIRGPVLRTQPVRGLCMSLQGTAQLELCSDIAGSSGHISGQILCSLKLSPSPVSAAGASKLLLPQVGWRGQGSGYVLCPKTPSCPQGSAKKHPLV